MALVSAELCTGCAACYNKCSLGAITMCSDKTGFLYPVIDAEKCIECGACEMVCPVMNKSIYNSAEPKAFIVQNTDDNIRKESTSGGAFTAIATKVIKLGGVVFGAAFLDDFHVGHTVVDNIDDLCKFRSSKYVQSSIGKCYKDAKKYLQTGRWVCFSGTPCQIQGLKKYLNREYERLVTVDFMCRAVPSPKVFRKYLDYQMTKYKNVNRVVFRDKTLGYSYSTLALYKKADKKTCLYRGGSESDQWLRLFLKGYCNRESCYNCKFQDGVRASDFTMWDCWGTQNYAPEWDDNKGTTNVIIWTERGREIFKDSEKSLRIKEIGIDAIDASLYRRPLNKPNYNKKEFYDDLDKLSSKEFIKKYVPMSLKIRVKRFCRYTVYRLHLHDSIRKVIHKVRKLYSSKLKGNKA